MKRLLLAALLATWGVLWKAGQDGADIGACDVPLVRRFDNAAQ